MELRGVLLAQLILLYAVSAQDIVPYLTPQERCKVAMMRGPCTIWSDKWFFNQTIQVCQPFSYGGCKGGNVFNTEAECLHYCIGGEHTLPPYLLSTEREFESWLSTTTSRPSVPDSERGKELTFPKTGYQTVFMMAQSNAFIQLDGVRIPTFQLRMSREISFKFKTRLPHGLLVYHSIKDRPEGLSPYALYVIVEKGQLKVVHVFGKTSTSVIVGEGLNRDRWHSVTVTIDVLETKLRAKVDDQRHEVKIQGVRLQNYGVTTNLTSVVLVGGLSPEEKLHGVKYIIESFVGCIKDMTLSAGSNVKDLEPIKPLIATKHDNVLEGCIDKCRTRENLCFVGSMCINHYNRLSCDCFGTYYEGEQCDIYTATILTLRGSSFVSYRVYDWKDRVHSASNRISLHFKTHFDNSALFYASGENPNHHHIAVSIVNATIAVDADLGDGSILTRVGQKIMDNEWHNLTILHVNNSISVYLDGNVSRLVLPGTHRHLYIDPEIYIGGGPELHKRKGLYSTNNFVGSLKYVFYNDVSILYELNKTNPKVHYIGVLEPLFQEEDVKMIPMTFPFPSSHFDWKVDNRDNLSMEFEFKSNRNIAVLAASTVNNDAGSWVLKTVVDELRFEVTPDERGKNVTHLLAVKFEPKGGWHTVELIYARGEAKLTVDRHRQRVKIGGKIQLGDKIVVGSTYAGKSNIGLVGCLKNVTINKVPVEPRYIVKSNITFHQISLDNCELVDPCKRPNACEHNGKCSVKDDRLSCDCKETGYIGKNCHFAQYRKTCEELALLGFTNPDVYLIDIDGNGRFPPAHVRCEFPKTEDATKTIVDHNLPSQVDVRGANEKDFSYEITYREFTSEMLQELISHSLYCSQFIKYECLKAPLELHSATWFVSAANNGTVDYLGNVKRGSCPCGVNRTCVNTEQSCNCDLSDAKWLSDEGSYMSPNSLGITKMVFLQQNDLQADAQGRITLGPLECVETNTQKYVVTFTTSQSYIEVPGWRKGDIAFSFRTTGEKAILLYQPPIRPHHPSFMVALTDDFQLTFNFTLNTGKSRELEVKSQRKLNSGEWQKIWIDYNEHHVRFMINTDFQMVDLLPEEEFGPFEGSMFIGGATEELLEERSVRQGLIGCFRGLVVNGEILDIYSYMSVHLLEIIKDCKPSCDPSPCKNGARCKELWSRFECVCENKWAYFGTFCETNINENGITLVVRDSYIQKNFLIGDSSNDTDKDMFKRLLNETILMNIRTYDNHSLVMHANDHLNNFIQLFIQNESTVVFAFNSGDTIYNVSVDYPDLNSGKSVQIAIVRNDEDTELHVNDKENRVYAPVNLLTNYSDKPWLNPENEVLAPPRPPAPPTEYFQVSLGGYNNLQPGSHKEPLMGYVGCLRGLKIGATTVNLTEYIESDNTTDDSVTIGMKNGCKMKCDENPCKNQGICIEDFHKGDASCDCEFTSYEGESCVEEKGADFGGESALLRTFDPQPDGAVYSIKLQLAFSSSDTRERDTLLALLEISNNYHLLIGLTSQGHLRFYEDRKGATIGVTIIDRSFMNGARHSFYYRRVNDSATLLIDRSEVTLAPTSVLSLNEEIVKNGSLMQIGGHNTTDPRFTTWNSYSGCLSNVLVEVNDQEIRPLEEYFVYPRTKTGINKNISVKNPHGIRSSQCSFFEAMNRPRPGPVLNYSHGQEPDQPWSMDPPLKIPYKSLYSDSSTTEESTGRILFIIAVSIFCTIIIGTLYHVYTTHRAYKRRKFAEAKVLWSSNLSIAYQEPPPITITVPPPVPKAVRSKSVCETNLYVGDNGRPVQYQEPLRPAIKLTRSKSQDDSMKVNGTDLKAVYRSSPVTPTPTVRFLIPSEVPQVVIKENGISHDEELVEDVAESDVLLGNNVTPEIIKAVPVDPAAKIAPDTYTINEDHDGELEEEEEMARQQRPRSVDFSFNDKGSPENMKSLSSSISSISSTGSRGKWSRLLGPMFLNERLRTFGNPLTYLGAPPRIFNRSRNRSKESVMSID